MIHNQTHGIMFHNFHNDKHKPVQGSLSEIDFRKMLIWLNDQYNLINASEYIYKFEKGLLQESDICLTFDDALKCQYDIAIPILREFKIKGFFFIYSSIFTEKQDPLEIYRYFRNSCFDKINDFYNDFFELVKKKSPNEFLRQYQKYKDIDHLSRFPFYTENDKWFRYIRDYFLTDDEYNACMIKLMEKKEFNISSAKKNLWISEDDLINIKNEGHVIGLHSHTHPTRISKLNYSLQEEEYQQNNNYLTKIIGETITSMSHPNGEYNHDTLDILCNLKIKIGFLSSFHPKTNTLSPFEIPREDHSNIYIKMNQ